MVTEVNQAVGCDDRTMLLAGRGIDARQFRHIVPVSGRLPHTIDFLHHVQIARQHIARFVAGEINHIAIIGKARLQLPRRRIDIRPHLGIDARPQMNRLLPVTVDQMGHPDIKTVVTTGRLNTAFARRHKNRRLAIGAVRDLHLRTRRIDFPAETVRDSRLLRRRPTTGTMHAGHGVGNTLRQDERQRYGTEFWNKKVIFH